MVTQQTQNICKTFIQCRPNVFNVGPALYKCYTNVLCLGVDVTSKSSSTIFENIVFTSIYGNVTITFCLQYLLRIA